MCLTNWMVDEVRIAKSVEKFKLCDKKISMETNLGNKLRFRDGSRGSPKYVPCHTTPTTTLSIPLSYL